MGGPEEGAREYQYGELNIGCFLGIANKGKNRLYFLYDFISSHE